MIARNRLACLTLWLVLPASVMARSHGEMLIDVSGSMNDTDEDRLRWDGILTFTQLLTLSEKNSLGVRYFTRRDQVKVEHTLVNRETYELFDRIAREKARSGGRTNLIPALKNATDELAQNDGSKYVVVVSDGVFSGGKEIEELLEKFAESGGVVYFVCLGPKGLYGDKVNTALVEACARTGGKAYGIVSGGDSPKKQVLEVFLEIFVQVSPPGLTLMSDPNGRFALNASNRSFVVLDPSGRRIKVFDPQGSVLSPSPDTDQLSREVRLRNWNVVGCERPQFETIDESWVSDRWRVVAADGEPLAGAHVYVHTDVEFEDTGRSGLFAAEGVDNRLEIGLSVGTLDAWAASHGEREFFRDAGVQFSLLRSDGGESFAALSGRLASQGDGTFGGLLPPTLQAGEYLAELEVVHPDFSVGRLSFLRVPLFVAPSYVTQELFVRDGPGEVARSVERDDASELYEGSEFRYQLQISPRTSQSHDDHTLQTTYKIRDVRLTLYSADPSLSIELPFERRNDTEGVVYATSFFPVGAEGR